MADLNGVIDLHVHAGPDVRERKTSAIELARMAGAAGMRGFLLKNHHTSTVLAAAAVAEDFPGLVVYGGLALNEWVGGLNVAAVEAAIGMGAREIWLPTLSAENQRLQQGRQGTGITVLREDGRLKPEVCEVIRLVAEADVILGTGHLSPCEISLVVREARVVACRKIIVTHPEIRFIQLPVSIQRDLRGPGVFFERCYSRTPLMTRSWSELAEDIRAVGVESTVLATDFGQPDNPDPVEGMAAMMDALEPEFGGEGVDVMCRRNPALLLGLDPWPAE